MNNVKFFLVATFLWATSACAAPNVVFSAKVFLDPPKAAPRSDHSIGRPDKDHASVMEYAPVSISYDHVLLVDAMYEATVSARPQSTTRVSPENAEPLIVLVFDLETGQEIFWADSEHLCDRRSCWFQSKEFQSMAKRWMDLFETDRTE